MLKRLFLVLLLGFFIPVSAWTAGSECSANFQTTPALFGYVENESWGKQIYFHEFGQMKDEFNQLRGQPWSEIESQLIANVMRRHFFHIRVLSQTYSSLDPAFFKTQVKQFKNIERLLGRVDLYKELEGIVQTMNEPSLIVYFEKLRQDSSVQLKQALDEFGFIENPEKAFQKLTKKYEKYDGWLTPKKDRKFLLKDAIKFTKALSKKIDDKAFDKNSLDDGLHKLRREIRELSYRLVNLEHLSLLVDEGELSPALAQWFDELKKANPDMLASVYIPESYSEVKNPILFPEKLNAMTTELIAEIGKIKDQQEPLGYIKSAAQDMPNLDQVSKARILKKVGVMARQLEDQEQVADAVQERLHETHLLNDYIHFLENHN